MLIDTHCHLDVEEFDADRQQVRIAAWEAGVGTIVVPGYLATHFDRVLALAEVDGPCKVLPALGLHPCYIKQHSDPDLSELELRLKACPRIVAVGEIGLDRYVAELADESGFQRQVHFFAEQLRLAQHYERPVLLHVRKAHQEVLGMLERGRFRQGGIVHAFSGGIEEARRYLKLGFRLGIGGSVTYDQSRRLRGVLAQVPLSALVLETDAPDMIAKPYRDPLLGGRTRNAPAFLPAVVSELAVLYGCSADMIEKITTQEAMQVLRLLPQGPV